MPPCDIVGFGAHAKVGCGSGSSRVAAEDRDDSRYVECEMMAVPKII